jgi:type IV secretion system protein VirB2
MCSASWRSVTVSLPTDKDLDSMTRLSSPLIRLALCLGLAGLAQSAAAQSSGAVDFSKADQLGTDLLGWMRGSLGTTVIAVAFAVTGFLAAFNRLSWMWPLMICVGAFLLFGGTQFASELKSLFG